MTCAPEDLTCSDFFVSLAHLRRMLNIAGTVPGDVLGHSLTTSKTAARNDQTSFDVLPRNAEITTCLQYIVPNTGNFEWVHSFPSQLGTSLRV
jgi:hypothetical protein